jgi:uncharacterized protein (TIGR01244 family)
MATCGAVFLSGGIIAPVREIAYSQRGKSGYSSGMIHRLDEHMAVAPQIWPSELLPLSEQGFALIINNRPDDEEAGQPASVEVESAARVVGLGYRAIPVTHAGFSHAQIDAMVEALSAARGPVLAYCRSGTRSCFLWALARARMGDDPATLVEKAAAAGYDLRPIQAMIEALGAGR